MSSILQESLMESYLRLTGQNLQKRRDIHFKIVSPINTQGKLHLFSSPSSPLHIVATQVEQKPRYYGQNFDI